RGLPAGVVRAGATAHAKEAERLVPLVDALIALEDLFWRKLVRERRVVRRAEHEPGHRAEHGEERGPAAAKQIPHESGGEKARDPGGNAGGGCDRGARAVGDEIAHDRRRNDEDHERDENERADEALVA